MKTKIFLILTGLLLTFFSCKKDNETTSVVTDYNRKTMLTNYSNNIITPRYLELKNAIIDVETKYNNFVILKNQSNLNALRASFKNSYIKWQACSFFDFGPSENYVLKTTINSFPTDTLKINNNILSGSYNLGTASNIVATGFPALDYLLFKEDLSSTLTYFNGDPKRLTYVSDIISQIKTIVITVESEWSTGSFSTSFIAADGTDAGSSLSKIINSLTSDFEKFIRDGKVGIPLGIRSLGHILPDKAEAFYSEESLSLLTEAIEQFHDYFNGNGIISGTNGLDDYLNHVDAKINGTLLSNKINSQFNSIKSKISILSNSISEEVTTNKTQVQELYDELQKLLILLKVNMPSALSTLITYKDNDGD